MNDPYPDIEPRSEKITLLMREPDRYIDLAHDTAAAETDKDERRILYRQLFIRCVDLGRWGDARIFQPFTGDEPRDVDARECLDRALAHGRAEDALELADYLGYQLETDELRELAKSLDAPGEPTLLRRLLGLAAFDDTPPFEIEDWIKVSIAHGRGELTDSEQSAFRILVDALRTEVVPAPDPDSDGEED